MWPQRLFPCLRMGGIILFLSIGTSFGQGSYPFLNRQRANLARSTTDSARTRWAIHLGDAFLNYHNDSAIYYFQHAAQWAEVSKNRMLQRLAYLKLGNEYLFYTDFLKAFHLLNKAEALGRSWPVDSTQLEIQIIKARALRSSGQFDTGLQLCLGLLNKYEHQQHRWPRQLALLQAELGIIHLHLRRYAESERYFQQQLRLSETSRNKRAILIALGNLGTLYGKNNRFKKANDCFEQAYDIAKQVTPPILLGYVYLNFGELAMHRKNYKAAIAYIKRSLQYGDSYQIDRGYSYLLLATCYQEDRHYRQALRHVNQAIDIFHSTASLQPEQEALSLKARLLAQTGQYETAFTTSERAQQYRDSLFGLEKEKSISQIQASFDLERNQQQIVALRKNLTIQQQAQKTTQLQLKVANQQRWLYLLILLSVSITLGFASLAYRRQKKIGQILLRQKEAIGEQAQELVELNATKDKLFSLISHDLRSPVAHLKSRLRQLRLTHLPADVQAPIDQLEVQTNQLLSLLTNLLEWSYMQLKGVRTHPKPVDLSGIILNVLAQMGDSIDHKRLKILNQVAPSTWVLADSIQLEAVVRNLFSNAVKFTPAEGFIRLWTQPSDADVVLMIQDTGIGMSVEQVEKLLHSPDIRPGTWGEPGTGLGLRICREILGSHPDALRIVSTPAKGTRVSIRLPICNQPALHVS